MKAIILVCLSLMSFVSAERVMMEDGKCYEQKGKIYYIIPCAKESSPAEEPGESAIAKKEKCLFTLGKYSVKYQKPQEENEDIISCADSLHYIETMILGYDKSLKTNKIKIGDLVVKSGLSKCEVELYYGDFITVGLMSGDRLMCDNFMVYHSTSGRAGRKQ
ncbi:MAG TPA: hypothetical protein ENL02_03450 [Epsilonproteobacteria bacterium]|nr:hypothetical protein [Campylobacterota bacterium]